jgi:hypothetical protein
MVVRKLSLQRYGLGFQIITATLGVLELLKSFFHLRIISPTLGYLLRILLFERVIALLLCLQLGTRPFVLGSQCCILVHFLLQGLGILGEGMQWSRPSRELYVLTDLSTYFSVRVAID